MLLDTSGLMCLFDHRDIRHSPATEHYDSAPNRLTHNYVLAEFVALAIARRAPQVEALRFIDATQNSDEIELAWVEARRPASCQDYPDLLSVSQSIAVRAVGSGCCLSPDVRQGGPGFRSGVSCRLGIDDRAITRQRHLARRQSSGEPTAEASAATHGRPRPSARATARSSGVSRAPCRLYGDLPITDCGKADLPIREFP